MDTTHIPSPSFVLNETLFRNNLQLIKKVADEAGIEIILAFKGFAMWSAFPIVKEYINGATASSLYESQLCVDKMGALAHTYAAAYHPDEFDGIVKNSSHIVFNSLTQFHTYYAKTQNAAHAISCGLRVNPEYSDVSTDLYNPSSPKSRLGILHENLPNTLPKGVEGMHVHVLCESNSYALEKTMLAFEEKFGKYIPQLKWVNFGGGHLMTRKGYNTQHLISILKAFKEKHRIDIILEPGSAFAWETGVLVAQVLDIVKGRGIQTAMLDVSFTAHMPDTLEMPYRPNIINVKDPNSKSKRAHLYRLGGVSCLAGDFMEAYDFGKELNIGDCVVFKDMIHYTMVKTTMFNGVNHPSIVIEKTNGELEIVKRFTYNDYKNRLS
ncbi:carboxynorspermidine decarboxylase [Wenyingzhuangia sp. IMCC45574]